ncbi:hypothetical protein [Pedobacter chitinilyticus]|uniref:Uncharacterized protein n=1 Tax=Pedobacter chitinilyticus TaxID=2233776 RepID=A0A3S4RR21_9SPHI|nr:hypothetical protein [Pedobacter chitinilyticus]RWU08111.1 hypothetical protein DPV69_06935 [Pedobacter chitinilyticus]
MKKKSTEKGESYALSANSKLAGLDFSRAMGWASKIYEPLKQYENWLCEDALFRRLKEVLLKLFATNSLHPVGHKQMCGGDVALLKKWRINNYGQWKDSLNLRLSLRVEPKSGETVLALNALVLGQGRLNPRCIGLGIRFYLLFLDEDKETSHVVVMDELFIKLGRKQEALEASFTFEPMGNGVLLLLGTCQQHLLHKDGHGSFASHDKNYYWANIMEAVAIKDGKLVNYEKKAVLSEEGKKVTKVGWVKRKG